MGKFKKALKALDGMQQIVENEMLVKGEYVSEDVYPERADQICQGHRYCAIGALWAGAGVKVQHNTYEYGAMVRHVYFLPGTDERTEEREEFLQENPHIAIALRHLDDAAVNLAREEGWGFQDNFQSALEDLFEDEDGVVGRPELLILIAEAREAIQQERFLKKAAA